MIQQPEPAAPAGVGQRETEAILVEVSLEIFLGKTMIGAQDECLGVANYDMRPVELARAGVVGLMLLGISSRTGI